MQPGLCANRHLKELDLHNCSIGDAGLHLLAESLVTGNNNTTLEMLGLQSNGLTFVGLADVTRLLLLEPPSTQLKMLDLGFNSGVFSHEASTRHFARALSRHEFLKQLNIRGCNLNDDGIRLIADSLLVGNNTTTLDTLCIYDNGITFVGLADITRLLLSMHLKTIYFGATDTVFTDDNATQHFVTTLQHTMSSVEELPAIYPHCFPESSGAATFAIIKNSLTRNQQLNRLDLLLLAPPPPPPQQRQSHHGVAAMMMFKTWHKAITKFAIVPNNAGASAIFKLFQARPQLLEKRLKRPPADAAATAAAAAAAASVPLEPKHPRL